MIINGEVPLPKSSCSLYHNSDCGKSVFLKNSILEIIKEYDKIYIYSPSLHQDLYQKLIKCFSNYIPIHVIPNNLIENDIDIVIEEIVNNKNFEESDEKNRDIRIDRRTKTSTRK